MKEITGTAFVFSGGMLHLKEAKTTHGLLRGSERFIIKAVIDENNAGKDAGEQMDGKSRGIPIYANLGEAINKEGKPDYCIIGVATVGGILPPELKTVIETALKAGISVINGLHDYLQNHAHLRQLAAETGAKLIDVRKPKAFKDLKFWTTEIYKVSCPIIAVLGMDCAVGKRSTARFIREACKDQGLHAEMIYTGQTGWMQGAKHGFIFDSTLNDFVCGELSNAIINAWHNENPDLILLEGQSALRNPSGPCGAEFLISGNAKYVVLVHQVNQVYFEDDPSWGRLPSIESEMALIEAYGSKVMALALNTSSCTKEEALAAQQQYHQEFRIPVLLPLEKGVEPLVPVLKKIIESPAKLLH